MLRPLLLAVALACAAAPSLAARDDPRKSLPGRPPRLSHAQWDAGRTYTFSFSSKAAHIEAALPHPDRVNPQTGLEDLGLWPFAVVEGRLALACVCRDTAAAAADAKAPAKKAADAAPAASVYCEATIHGVRNECGKDATRSGTTCERLGEVAASLPVWPFGLVFSDEGELLETRFHAMDDAEVRGIKQNLVADLGLSPPRAGEGGNGARYTRTRREGNATVTEVTRVRPYTQLAHRTTPPVDGLMVLKSRVASVNATAATFRHRRRSWVYTIVGGDSEFEEPAAVPTRVASTEEAEVNPARIPKALNGTGSLYVLSRLELNLRATGTLDAGIIDCPFKAKAKAKAAADAAEKAVAKEEAAFGSGSDAVKKDGGAAGQDAQRLAKTLAAGDEGASSSSAEAPSWGAGTDETSESSSGSAAAGDDEEAPVRVAPGSFLEVGEAPLDAVSALRSAAASLQEALQPSRVDAARPLEDRVMQDEGAQAFDQMLATEAANFDASRVAVGPDPEQ